MDEVGQTKHVLTEDQLTQIKQLRAQVVDDDGFEQMIYGKLDMFSKSDVLENLDVYIHKDGVELLAQNYADKRYTFEKLMDDMTLRVPLYVDIDARQMRVGVLVLKTIGFTNVIWNPYDIVIDDDELERARRMEEAVLRHVGLI